MSTSKTTRRKSEQARQAEQEIIKILKERHHTLLNKNKNKRGIAFSDYTDISIRDKNLTIHIAHNNTVNKYPVAEEVQTDGAAFEGWAICLKSWLPDKVDKVLLTWDKPPIKNGHYNRFLYRVWRFKEMYNWFEYDETDGDIEAFKNEFEGSRNNSANKEGTRKEKGCEEQVEYDMVKHNQQAFINWFNLKSLHRHLPVGIKKKDGSSLFTGRNSAIDLWGIGYNNVLHIFELKYITDSKKAKNIKVGIISELLLYINIMNDIRQNIINTPQAKLEGEKELYTQINNLTGVKGIFLTNELHPLLENKDDILCLLNDNNKKISFAFADYNWDNRTNKVCFKCI